MNNESEIKILIENWAQAIRNKDMEKILAHHAEDIVMYDMPELFQSVGITAYRKTWNTFFSWAKDSGVFNIRELNITAGENVAFCFGAMQCAGTNITGVKETLDFRLTIGLRKMNKQWIITHEHHSVPGT